MTSLGGEVPGWPADEGEDNVTVCQKGQVLLILDITITQYEFKRQTSLKKINNTINDHTVKNILKTNFEFIV